MQCWLELVEVVNKSNQTSNIFLRLQFFEISLTRGYGENEFREDLKELFKLVAVSPTTFLFTDAHVAEESFLENVNNMLSTGMVPALFASDERSIKLINKRKGKKAGVIETPDNLWNFSYKKRSLICTLFSRCHHQAKR